MKNVLSFDVEEWFHAEAFGSRFPKTAWNDLESRVMVGMEIILNFLSKKNVKATFFFLGWIAEKHPEIIKITSDEGHEIASHGYNHIRVDKLSPAGFRDEVKQSVELLYSISGKEILGYRAPTFSITRETLWALPILLEEGIKYDSSVFPIHHDRYGIPEAPFMPYVAYQNGKDIITEFPMSTVQIGKYNLPFGGGGYFRLYPLWLSMKFIEKCQLNHRPVIFYAHPWEFDTGIPKIDLNAFDRIRHYYGYHKILDKLNTLVSSFEFTSFERSSVWESVDKNNNYLL